jgi:hypothetical protein
MMTSTRWTAMSARRLGRLGAALVVAAGALVATSPPAFAFTPAPHTQVPDLQKNNYVGKPLRLVSFVQDDGHPADPTTYDSRVLWFGKALVNSHWYAAASPAYNLGAHGTAFGRRILHMPVSNNSTTSSFMTQKVRNWMHAMGLHRNPAVRTVFLLYLPCVPGTTWVGGIGGCGTAAWHPRLSFTSPDPDFTAGDSMALVWVPQGSPPTVDGSTVTATHEVMEAVTDTDGPGWQMHSFTPNPFDVSPWIFNENQNGNTEVMDMAGGSRITERFANATHGYSYRYERVFTNHSANANHDPFVPASPLGYASVTNSTNGWVRQSSAHTTHRITLTAWSTRVVPNWTLSVSVAAWKGGTASPATVDRCAASLSRTTVNNGTSVTLTVHYTGSPTARYWCAIKVKSTTAGASPTGTTNDRFRQWLVGLRLEPPA